MHKPHAPMDVPFDDVQVHIARSRMRDRPVVLALGSNLGDRLAIAAAGGRLTLAQPGDHPLVAASLGVRDGAGGRAGAGRLPERGGRRGPRLDASSDLLALAQRGREPRTIALGPLGTPHPRRRRDRRGSVSATTRR